MSKKDEALKLVLEALEEIALAGMSGTGQESEEAMTAWHARQAWKFIGIAARALEPIKQALELPVQEPVECQYGNGGYACCEGGPCKADEQNNATQTAAPLTDELSNAVQMACQLSFKDHGRRSVNEQAWQRLMQAVAAYTHGITGKGQP